MSLQTKRNFSQSEIDETNLIEVQKFDGDKESSASKR